ncbi:MAG: branched-chain amino acid ABC transporter permease [Herpetosiphon sp.]
MTTTSLPTTQTTVTTEAARVRRRAILTVGGALLGAALFGALSFILPGNSYVLYILFLVFLYMTESMAWNLVGGFAGQTSFGHATFFGIGAYTTALLQARAGLPPLAAMLIGGAGAAVFGILWGYPLFRLRGFYFAIATIGINEATRLIALNPLRDYTGGASGLSLNPELGSQRSEQYLMALGLALATFLVSYWLRYSRVGLGLFALNMDSEASETLGVNTARLKAIALALSAFLVGLAGGIYVRAFLYINPNDVFAFATSIAMVLMAVIGGVGTLVGPILGAIVYVVLQDQLGAAHLTLGGRTLEFRDLQLGLYGLLLALIILFEPAGLVGLFRRLSKPFRKQTRGGAKQGALLRDETGSER